LIFNLIEEYVKKGAKGFGEILANLKFNDKRMKNIYRGMRRVKNINSIPSWRGPWKVQNWI
jgi:hypothetical protein